MNSSELFPNLRILERLHRELDEERRARAEDRQRLRDTARNILRLGLSVEQAVQDSGLPPETVRILAARP